MGTRINIQVGQALLAQRVRDLAALNREQRIEREQKVRESNAVEDAMDAMAAKDAQRGQPQNNTIDWKLTPEQYDERLRAQGKKSGVPEYYTAPKVAVTPKQQAQTLAIGWVEPTPEGVPLTELADETTIKVISGDGSASASLVMPGHGLATLPALAEVQWTSDWGSWYYQGTVSGLAGTFWLRTRDATDLTIRVPYSAGNRLLTRMVMPFADGLVLSFRDVAKQKRHFYEVQAGTRSGILGPRAIEGVQGGPGDDPATLYANSGTFRFLDWEGDLAWTVSNAGTSYDFDIDDFHSFVVRKSSVTSLASTPSTVQAGLVGAYDGAGTFGTTSNIYDINGTNSVYNVNAVLGLNYSFGGQVYNEFRVRQVWDFSPAVITNAWPLVTVPTYDPYGGPGYDMRLFEGIAISGMGLAYRALPTQQEIEDGYGDSGSFIGAEFGGTPFTYRALLDEYQGDVPSRFGTPNLLELLQQMAPLPSKFSIIASSFGIDFQPKFDQAETAIRFPNYSAQTSNIDPNATWDSFVVNGLPSAAGRPSAYKGSLVPQAARQSYTTLPQMVAGATFGENAYCQTKLLELGFTAEDLTP